MVSYLVPPNLTPQGTLDVDDYFLTSIPDVVSIVTPHQPWSMSLGSRRRSHASYFSHCQSRINIKEERLDLAPGSKDTPTPRREVTIADSSVCGGWESWLPPQQAGNRAPARSRSTPISAS